MSSRSFPQVRLAFVVAAAVGAVFTAPAAAQTPPLAEVARKEQERRKVQKPAAKVYTKKDLPESGRVPPPPAAAPAPAAEQAPAPTEQKRESDGKDETWWRNRIGAAREELRRNEVFAEALQSRINALSADFVNRDDPFQRAKVGQDRDKAVAELARVKDEIARGKKQIEDIEEEGRKAGVPPGWLR
ncbi:MAG TPA: hypothetical protein VE379_01470 [Vicinamibacterales bacterium]|jgi:cell division septation protein DedD|nr:hypothetical protein [Vicinamibacterales bacterium]